MHHWVISIVDRSKDQRGLLKSLFRGNGCTVHEFDPGATAREALQTTDALVVGSEPGLALVLDLRPLAPHLPIIFAPVESSEALAVEALRARVTDYLAPPATLETVAAMMERLRSRSAEVEEEDEPRLAGGDRMVGASAVIRELKARLLRSAASNSNVLITGETGTGKELAAELIHRNSRRRSKPLVCLNCTAIPDSLVESELFGYEKGAFTGAHRREEGKLWLAQGGTVFLDEIGHMTAFAQAKLLRAIEGKPIYRLGGKTGITLDVRVIAATNQDLEAAVDAGEFRQDLYYRLNVVRLRIPPLRERPEDIPLLVDFFIAELNPLFGRRVDGLARSSMDLLLAHPWPGNIRELRNLLEASFVEAREPNARWLELSPVLRCHLEQSSKATGNERERLLKALTASQWNKSRAAAELHWSRMTVYRKMLRYGLVDSRSAPPRKSASASGGHGASPIEQTG